MKGLYRRKDGKSKNYRFSVMHKGVRHQGTTGTANRKKAELVFADILCQIDNGTWDVAPEQKADPTVYSFEELVERYMAEHSIPTKT